MGDGRYYTTGQFMVVVFLTIFLVCLTVSTVTCMYQGFREKGKNVLYAHLFLGFAAVLQFVAAVVPSRSLAESFSMGTLFCLLCSFILIFTLLYSKVDGPANLFKSWRLRSYCKQHPLPFCLYLLPVVFIAAKTFIAGIISTLVFLLTYPCWLGAIHIFAADFKMYWIGRQVFSGINDRLQDAVLVCDVNHHIIYRNSHAHKACFLQQGVTTVLAGNPAAVFTDEFEQSQQYSHNTFASINRKQWLQYKTKDIYHGKQKVGQVVVVSDITHLVAMLETQGAHKKRLEEVNRKLHHYSTIVFDLEKERETTLLLKNITNKQVTVMQDIRSRTNKVLAAPIPDMSDLHTTLDTLIKDTKRNLSRIRYTISKYRNYYGEGN